MDGEVPSPNCGCIVARPFNEPNTYTHFLYYGYSIGEKQRPLIITVCTTGNKMITYVLDQIDADSIACHWPWSAFKCQRSLLRISAYKSTLTNILYNNNMIIIFLVHIYVLRSDLHVFTISEYNVGTNSFIFANNGCAKTWFADRYRVIVQSH